MKSIDSKSMAQNISLIISPPSGIGTDYLIEIDKLPLQILSYDKPPNWVFLTGVSGAGKDSILIGLYYLIAYSSITESTPQIIKDAVSALGRTVALEDRLAGLINNKELEKFRKYDSLESTLDYQAALDESLKSGEKNEKLISDCIKRIKNERNIILAYLDIYLPFERVRSHTTREKGANEKNGDVYIFISLDNFESKVISEAYLEIAENYGKGWYATPNVTLSKSFAIKLVDVQGASRIIKTNQFHKEVKPYFIFVDTPNKTMKNRLEKRGRDKPEDIEKRLKEARTEREKLKELRQYAPFGYVENTGNIYRARMSAYNLLVDSKCLGDVKKFSQYPTTF
jgi:guanylate kinase